MKTVQKNWNRALSGLFFFSPETISKTISKGDDIKIKRKKSVLFYSSSTRLSSSHCGPFSIFCPFTWLGGGLKVSEIKVKQRW